MRTGCLNRTSWIILLLVDISFVKCAYTKFVEVYYERRK